MARLTLSELIDEITNKIQENTSGDITATILNELLDLLTNNLYLPTDATLFVEDEGTPLGSADTLNFENLSLAFLDGKLTVTAAVVDAGLQLTNVVAVNQLTDLPAAVAGVITLAAGTTYLLGNDINLGTDRLVLLDRAVISGSESLNTSLTYTGTGDMFTMVDATNRISDMTVNCVNGRLINWSDTVGGNQLRFNDVQGTCATFGTFTGLDSLLRFTNISPAMTVDGLVFAGTWLSLLWEVSGADVQAGTFFDLGTAVFDSILIDKTLMVIDPSATFLSGLADSGNIATGGLGTVLLTRTSGGGTLLSGITTDDALWEFFHNDDIQDTRPDALLSLQGNVTPETITVAGTPVKVTGGNAWVDERSSQSTNDNTGKSTYDGGKPVVVPITLRGSVEPVSGTNKTISLYVALNGSPIAGSKATARVDAGNPQSITVIWQEEAVPGDYVEMFISNDTDTTDVVVSTGIIRIN